MAIGKTIRIYLPEGSVGGIRHGEIVNWTGQAIACPRARFGDLKEWPEARRPGVYFLFGIDEDTGREAAYIGEAEFVAERVASHIAGKDFWTDLVAFTSKDDNLTKGHVRYLESRLVEIASSAGRHALKNAVSPQLSQLPRPDRDSMEEFIENLRILLGVLGHRVLEPLAAQPVAQPRTGTPSVSPPAGSTLNQIPESSFHLRVGTLSASAVRTDEGIVVRAGSDAAEVVQPSLSVGYRTLRELADDNYLGRLTTTILAGGRPVPGRSGRWGYRVLMDAVQRRAGCPARGSRTTRCSSTRTTVER